MKTLGSVASVIAAIREEAAAEMERLARDADATAPNAAEASPLPSVDDDPRVSAACRRAEDDELDTDWNAAVEDLQDREQWMTSVAAAGRRQLTTIDDPGAMKQRTRALVLEAIEHLPPGACVVVVPAAVSPLLDGGWCAAMERETGRRMSVTRGAITAGCIVRVDGQPVEYDNSIEARQRRFETEWRAALARVYAGAAGRALDAAAAAPSDVAV